MAECHVYTCEDEATHVVLFATPDPGKKTSRPRFAYRCDDHAEEERGHAEDTGRSVVSLEEAEGEPANLWRWTRWEEA